jgi:predicted acylesterase/phospholipase RssA
MGVKQWPMAKCAAEFQRLCDTAFTKRTFGDVPGLQKLETAVHGSKWRTTPLHEALRESLGRDLLFGGKKERNNDYALHVAVTTTSGTGTEALLIANYCRPPDTLGEYSFVRADAPPLEMRLWEAAAATSAAPTYFKPFLHGRTSRTFMDGALCYNNPTRVANTERKLLWPDVADQRPDLLLSIGTGTNSKTTEKERGKNHFSSSQALS